MNNNLQEIIGSVISAIGTIQAAISNTPQFNLNEIESYEWKLVGNVLQALGGSLSADGQGTESLEKLGDEIGAVGNSTVVTSLLLYKMCNTITEQKLIISGSWIQALGSFVGLIDEFFDSTDEGRIENIVGGFLQGIGNSLQAIGGIEELDNIGKKQYQNIGVIGSWIQASGSVLSLIGQIKEELEEIRQNINE
ncbi:Uncharacterised protein [Niallia circulans]|uniref:Uncharacterized protein n=1 Tax=Niallia circulans TaxID=1397 RepID=A0A0J1L234_NIACI|nr:hypothetical protein [Niallia circulans]KLV23060.1 hypothetical protein ABW02_20240 [Niallia circulans]MDR4317875.1 hypothetical protein [Niallia circulans]MED3841662.1 hypothetical protein [Niallia circulans]MED4243398.1 hypothetical protein [Niallia circulans]MED4248297.1 hypothetical protein [Niallia circulans]